MKPTALAILLLALPSATLLLAVAPPSAPPVPTALTPVVVGLDHIPIAVADLERAAERYRRLGFTLKPGRAHKNGIRNQHAKFADGTELELITAPEGRDSLTRHLFLAPELTHGLWLELRATR